MTGVLTKREGFEAERHTGKMPQRQRLGRCISKPSKTQRLPANHQKLGHKHKTDPLWHPSGETNFCWHLDLYFEPPEQGQKTISFCFLSCLACRTLLQQLQESNMEMLPSSTWSKRVYHHVCIPTSRKDKDRRQADLLLHFMSYPIGHKLVTWSYLLQGTLGNEVFILGSHVPR